MKLIFCCWTVRCRNMCAFPLLLHAAISIASQSCAAGQTFEYDSSVCSEQMSKIRIWSTMNTITRSCVLHREEAFAAIADCCTSIGNVWDWVPVDTAAYERDRRQSARTVTSLTAACNSCCCCHTGRICTHQNSASIWMTIASNTNPTIPTTNAIHSVNTIDSR